MISLPAQRQLASPLHDQQLLLQLPDDSTSEQCGELAPQAAEHCTVFMSHPAGHEDVPHISLHVRCDQQGHQQDAVQLAHHHHGQHSQSDLSHASRDSLSDAMSQQLHSVSNLTAGMLFLTEGYSPGRELQTALETLQSIAQGEAQCCLTGPAFEHLLQHAEPVVLESIMQHAVVFARMKSHQKGQVVELLGAKGLHRMVQGQERSIPVRLLITDPADHCS